MKEYIVAKRLYTSSPYVICDRNKNTICPRVKQNLPCGDCKGTKYMEFAKVFTDDEPYIDTENKKRTLWQKIKNLLSTEYLTPRR